jgi:hypothetical protein
VATEIRRGQAESALLDDQAAVFHVEQPGPRSDGPGLGRGDAELQPQRGRAGTELAPTTVMLS